MKRSTAFLLTILLVGWLSFLYYEESKESFVQPDVSSQSDTNSKNPSNVFPSDHGAAYEEALLSSSFLHSSPQQTISSEVEEKSFDMNSLLDEHLDLEDIAQNSASVGNIDLLGKLYQKTQKLDVLKLLLSQLVKNYRFGEAREYVDRLDLQTLKELDISLLLSLYFNSFSLSDPNAFVSLRENLSSFFQAGMISSSDLSFTLGLLDLVEGKKDAFFTQSEGVSQPSQKAFVQKVRDIISQVHNQKDMPVSYQDGLISLALMKNGYFQLAKFLALKVLKQTDSYILPYQVLAYSNFLTQSWDSAGSYFLKLIDLDTSQKSLYQFFIGVSYYWGEKYQQSVLYLSQVDSSSLQLDAQRYLLLNYLALGAEDSALSIWQKMLGYPLEKSDFYAYFYHVFFEPYAQGKEFSLYEKNPQLTEYFLQQCASVFSTDEQICRYGAIGKYLQMGDLAHVEKELLSLSASFPQSYVYQALGELFLQKGDREEAKGYLIRAAGMTDDLSEQATIKRILIENML